VARNPGSVVVIVVAHELSAATRERERERERETNTAVTKLQNEAMANELQHHSPHFSLLIFLLIEKE
jgi:hypothetical protein